MANGKYLKSSISDCIPIVLAALFIVSIAVVIALAVAAGNKNQQELEDRHQALQAYAQRTNGHIEKYVSGSHIEDHYTGTIETGSGKSRVSTSIYTIEVAEWSERIIYFDGRTPYYPEDHQEWLEDLGRIKAERSDK